MENRRRRDLPKRKGVTAEERLRPEASYRTGKRLARARARGGSRTDHRPLGAGAARAGHVMGRVRLEGTYVAAHAAELRRRVDNVAARAAYTQPDRRVLDVLARGRALEVLTTSQELAHRIAHEIEKAFRGKATYRWSDADGRLLATWRRDERPPSKRG
jgi:hypothetical protein